MKNKYLKAYDTRFAELHKHLAALQAIINHPEFQAAAEKANESGSSCYYQDYLTLVEDLKEGIVNSTDEVQEEKN